MAYYIFKFLLMTTSISSLINILRFYSGLFFTIKVKIICDKRTLPDTIWIHPQTMYTAEALKKKNNNKQQMQIRARRAEKPTKKADAFQASERMVPKSSKRPSQVTPSMAFWNPVICSSQYSNNPKYPIPGLSSVSPIHWGWMNTTMLMIAKQMAKIAHMTPTARELRT